MHQSFSFIVKELIEFIVEQHDMVYPMVPAGADLNEMISRPVHDQFQESEM